MLEFQKTVEREVALLVLRTAENDDEFFAWIVEVRAASVCRQLSRLGIKIDENDQLKDEFIRQAIRLRSAWIAIN